MIKIRENKGVTLIAIIVTIIILIILAGISISAITGNNSLIKQAGKAKYESGGANEREILELEIAKSMDKSLDGTVTAGDLDVLSEIAEVSQQGKYINVAFNDGGKKYRIDPYGNIKENNRKIFESPTTSIYAKLYTDKTLILSSYNYTDPSREVQTDYENNGGWQSSGCTKIIIYDEIAPSTGYNLFENCSECKKIENLDNLHTEFMQSTVQMFSNCNSLEDLDMSFFDTSKVNDMRAMFANCKALQKADISLFDTSKVTSMENLFAQCWSISEIEFGEKFDTSQVKNMLAMFRSCKKLKGVDLKRFDTRNVEKMAYMFYDCGNQSGEELKLDFKNFNTSKVKEMQYMFYGCSTLKTIDLSSFYTDSLEKAYGMFWNCTSLEHLDLSNAVFQNATNMENFFAQCYKLSWLNFKNVDFSNVTSYNNFFVSQSWNVPVPITIVVSNDENKATNQKSFLTARRQEKNYSIPTYVTE